MATIRIAAAGLVLLLFAAPPTSADFVYVSESSSKLDVLQVDPAGNKSVFATTSTPGLPDGIAFDGSGNLYVGLHGGTTFGRIQEFSPSGQSLGDFATAGLNTPRGMTFDSAGNLYVANFHDITKYSSTGQFLGVFASAGLDNPYDLEFDSAGNLYVSLYNRGAVKRFSSTGQDLGNLTSAGFSTNLQGLAVDSSGNLYVVDKFFNNIRKFSSTGQDLGIFVTAAGSSLGDIEFDSSGILYAISDSTIHKYSATGQDLGTLTTGLDSPAFLAIRSESVPEPAAVVLLGIGGLGVLGYCRRRRGRSNASIPLASPGSTVD